jgi:hypothetical protein
MTDDANPFNIRDAVSYLPSGKGIEQTTNIIEFLANRIVCEFLLFRQPDRVLSNPIVRKIEHQRSEPKLREAGSKIREWPPVLMGSKPVTHEKHG